MPGVRPQDIIGRPPAACGHAKLRTLRIPALGSWHFLVLQLRLRRSLGFVRGRSVWLV